MTNELDLTIEAMTISQLAEASGVPTRRIRHFIAEGLLPPPHGRGRAAHYGREHLLRLQQIQAYRDVNLGLEEIRHRLGDVRHGPSEVSAAPESWTRWEIVPGIELHARVDLEPSITTLARVLVGVARQLMTPDDGDPAAP